MHHGGRSSRSPEGKKEAKGLHSTFAKAEAETVQPEKADHLILPAQRVDTAFPSQPSDRSCPKPQCLNEFAGQLMAAMLVIVHPAHLSCCMKRKRLQAAGVDKCGTITTCTLQIRQYKVLLQQNIP